MFDDHDTCDDLDTELHIDFPVLPPQQSAFDGPPNLENIETIKEKRKKVVNEVIEHLQKHASQLVCTLHPTTDVPFRLSCKTLDTSYAHRHSSPSLLASIRSVLLSPVLPTPTVLPSDDDNDPLPESGSHGYSRSTPDPKYRDVAMCHAHSPLWLLAEKAEMDDLIKRKVWKTVKRSSLNPEDHIFATRFHYKIKRKNGAFERCKVRLVVQGHHMKKKDASGSGDFEDSFSSVPHASGLCLMLVLATQHNMFTDHVDISQTFVQGDLLPGDDHNVKVYISSPPGYPEDSEICYLLQKPLYVMPSATLVTRFCSRHTSTISLFLALIVLLLTLFAMLYSLASTAPLTVPSRHIWAVKLNVTCPPALLLSPRNTTQRTFFALMDSGDLFLSQLCFSPRPDLVFAYSELSKYVQRPGKVHMSADEHTLRYLRDTFDKSLRFSRDCPIVDTPWGWVDSDWAGDTDTRRSHVVYIIMMNGGPISWKSRRQDSVALSTSEAKYMAASEVGKEILYLRTILRDVGYAQTVPSVHFCRELYAVGVMKLIPLRTHLMVADALTKSLPGPVLTQHREVMLGHTPFFARLLH